MTSKVENSSTKSGFVNQVILNNHVRAGVTSSADDPLVTGQLRTLIPGKHKERADMKQSDKNTPLKEKLENMWRSFAKESAEMSADYGHRQNEWRVNLEDGTDFVIRLTDAASPHTKKRFKPRNSSTEHSGMIMVWYGIEQNIDVTNIEANPINPIVKLDHKSESGVSFFSNQQLIEQYPQLPDQVHKTIKLALATAVGILQDEMGIPDEEVGPKIDINFGIGSRLDPERKLGKQGQGSQSSPWGHFVVVYHDDDERVAEKMPLHTASPKEMLKVMDPWVELFTQQFGESLTRVAQQSIAQERKIDTVEQIKLKSTWDGLEIIFPDEGVDVTAAYSAVSSIYTALSDIHRMSVSYYKRFLRSEPSLVELEKNNFKNRLVALGMETEETDRYLTFLESLSPSYSVVTELLQGSVQESKKARLMKIQKKLELRNSETGREAQSKRQLQRNQELSHLYETYSQLLATQQFEQADMVRERIVTVRARLLASHLRNQFQVDPAATVPDKKTEPTGVQDGQDTIAAEKKLPEDKKLLNEIDILIPLSKLTAVVVVKDFTYNATDGMKIQSMRVSLSDAGRGGFEVMTENSQIWRERPQ